MLWNDIRAYQYYKPLMLRMAIEEAIHKADSYRSFDVGSCYLTHGDGKYNLFSGHNIKPTEDSPKYCAEKDALYLVRYWEQERVIAIVVASKERQADSESGKNPLTLHPCHTCRVMMSKANGLISPDTYICTTNLEQTITEEYNLESLLAYHVR